MVNLANQMTTTPQARVRDSEAFRLQKDVETLTKTVSLHQRRTASLDESLRHVKQEVTAKREFLHTALPSIRDVQRLSDRTTLLENRLLKEKVKLNKEMQENRVLKDRIDEQRREKTRLLSLFQQLQKNAERLESEAKDLTTKAQVYGGEESDMKINLLALREKAKKKIDEVETRVLESARESHRVHIKDPILSISLYSDNDVFIDSITVLRKLYRTWVDKVKEQKSAVEKYNRTMHQLSESFEEIRNATGLATVEEIVTVFIKAYNQEQDMNETLSHLSSEADALQDLLTSIESAHKIQLSSYRKDLVSQQDKLMTLQKELETLKSMYETRIKRQFLLQSEMQSVEDPVNHLLSLFTASQIPPGFDVSTDSELVHRVNHIEKALNFVLTYLSSGQGPPVSFETGITDKSFGEQLKVMSPVHVSVNEETEEPLTEEEIRLRAARRVHLMKQT